MKKLLVFCCLLISFTGLKASVIDSILSTLNNLEDSSRVDSVIKIARLYSMTEEGLKGEEVARWSLNKAYEKGYKDLIPKARFYLAYAYDNQGKIDSCILNYNRALDEMKGTKHEDWEKHVYVNSINSYRNGGRYKEALNSAFKALDYVKEENDTDRIAFFYSEVGYVYDRMKEFKKALEWHHKSLKLYKKLEDEFSVNFVNGRIGIAHDDLGNFDSAHFYNKIALQYCVDEQYKACQGIVSSNIGNTYIKQKNWVEAYKYINEAFEINKQEGDLGNIAISAINLGNVQIHLKEFKKARKSLQVGLENAIQWGGVKFQSEANYRLYELFEQKEEYDSALFFYKAYESLEDSLYGIEKAKQIAELSTEYETKEKENQLEIQALSIKEKDSKLVARQRMILLLIVLSISITLIGITLYQRYRSKKEKEIQNIIIDEQEKSLKAVFNAQEEERKRISKDLHDGVGQQLSGLKMAFQKLSGSIKRKLPEKAEEIEQLAQVVSESADEVRSISHQMMPRALTELGLIDALKDMLNKSLQFSEINYEFDHYGLNDRLAERVEVSLYRVCQELINNIIKHSKATHVNVHLYKNQGKVILIVEDNGSGISSRGSDGHGLLNIKSRVNTLNGEMNLEPSPNSGTLATIRIPL